jgi:hypothetical protein
MGVSDLTQGREALTPPQSDLPVVIPFRGLVGARGGVGAGEGGDGSMTDREDEEMTESMEVETGEEVQESMMQEGMEVDNERADWERERQGKRKKEEGWQGTEKPGQRARRREERDEEERMDEAAVVARSNQATGGECKVTQNESDISTRNDGEGARPGGISTDQGTEGASEGSVSTEKGMEEVIAAMTNIDETQARPAVINFDKTQARQATTNIDTT